jgi:PHD/YefM family antitoxin component YafN of YafNO toxin-antitoxin module
MRFFGKLPLFILALGFMISQNVLAVAPTQRSQMDDFESLTNNEHVLADCLQMQSLAEKRMREDKWEDANSILKHAWKELDHHYAMKKYIDDTGRKFSFAEVIEKRGRFEEAVKTRIGDFNARISMLKEKVEAWKKIIVYEENLHKAGNLINERHFEEASLLLEKEIVLIGKNYECREFDGKDETEEKLEEAEKAEAKKDFKSCAELRRDVLKYRIAGLKDMYSEWKTDPNAKKMDMSFLLDEDN